MVIIDSIVAVGIFFCPGQPAELHWRHFSNGTFDYTSRCQDGTDAGPSFYKTLLEKKLITTDR